MAKSSISLFRRILTGGQPRPFAWFERSKVRKTVFLFFFALLVLATLHVSFRIALRRVWHSERQMDLATESMLAGQFEDALDHYDQAIGGNRWKRQAWLGRGLTLLYLKRYDEALASYEHLIKLDHDNVQGWQGKGMSLEFMGRYDEALESYDRALEISPDFDFVTIQRDRLREHTEQQEMSVPSSPDSTR